MDSDPRTPVLVGAGQVCRRPDPDEAVTDRPEPAELMAEALALAAADSGAPGEGKALLGGASSVWVVRPVTWHYANPGLAVAERLGFEPAGTGLGPVGGNTPLALAARAARAIAAGELDTVAVVGADCLFTRLAARRDPERPLLPWTVQPATTPEPVALGQDRHPVTPSEEEQGLDRPTTVFPLFENALRFRSGASLPDHQIRISQLWARFAAVAADNPYAWTRQAPDAETIRSVGPDNRMIAFPYPKLLCANDRVDQGAGFILCSLEAARAAGVPADRMVFPQAVAEATDHWFLTHRQDLGVSPAMEVVGRRALALAGAGLDDVELLDLYSCFPGAVEMAAAALGLPLDDSGRPLTVTGGLTFAGGPINNYVSHSIATMAHRLRERPGALGLTTGLGWYATKHATGLWSTAPPAGGFRFEEPQAEIDARPQRAPASDYEGETTVETYTVVHGPDGAPERAVLALLDPDGRRAWGTSTDADTMALLESEEGCGRRARLGAGGRVDLRS